jgi:hypothetical protein
MEMSPNGNRYRLKFFEGKTREKKKNNNALIDIPKSLVVSYVCELPFGQGKKFGSTINSVTYAILGGWQTSGVVTF